MREGKSQVQYARALYWGAHQRFFKSLIIGFKVPGLVAIAKQSIALGKSVVIGLQSTGEAHTDRWVAEAGGGDGRVTAFGTALGGLNWSNMPLKSCILSLKSCCVTREPPTSSS